MQHKDMVTSNHVHLLVYYSGSRDMISKSVQRVAGRTGHQYNQHKRRKGALMVRAGMVNNPSEWPFSGYGEIQEPRQRYALIDYAKLKNLLGIESYDQ